ncbi:MAG TPA: DUF935 family protein [Verrucomicrobiota bacterium]|nr:DUF935 family protein [Verrucomicrobiota bacterium]
MNLLTLKGWVRVLSLVKARGSTPPASGNHKLPPGLETIVLPAARDRWRSRRVAHYTTEMIEQVLAGAFNGDLTAQWELFDVMEETSPRLLKNLMDLKSAVVGLEWPLQPWAEKGERPTAVAVAKAKFCERAVWRMVGHPARDENDFPKTIRDVLDGWGKGIALLEVDYTVTSAAVMPRCTRYVHPRLYGYPFDSAELKLNVREVRASRQQGSATTLQALPDADWMAIPDQKFLVAIAQHKSGHPVTKALLRPLAFLWGASNFGLEWLINYAQIFGQPIRWATYDPSRKDLLSKICAMMENLGSAGWAVFPSGTTLELKEAAKSGQDNPQAFLLKLYDKTCDLLIRGETLTSDEGDSGSRSLGEVHEGKWGDTIQGAATWSAGVLKQLLRAICILNFGNDDECPEFAPSRKKVKDAKALVDRDKVLLDAGIELPKQWFLERHDIPATAPGEEVITGRAPTMDFTQGGFVPSAVRPRDFSRDDGHVSAKAADEVISELVRQAVADAAGARVRWLEPLQEEIDALTEVIRQGKLSDEGIGRFIESAAQSLPDLFGQLNTNALADSLEDALGAAAFEGVREALKKK